MLIATPMTITKAKQYVNDFHRHNKAPQGALFAIGASDGDQIVGVALIGRPVSRHLDDGFTAEVTRVCVIDDAPKNTCSFLYGNAWRAAKAMGYTKIITYTLQSESGASLRGAGWKIIAKLAPSNPAAWQSRPNRDRQPVVGQAKFRWQST